MAGRRQRGARRTRAHTGAERRAPSAERRAPSAERLSLCAFRVRESTRALRWRWLCPRTHPRWMDRGRAAPASDKAPRRGGDRGHQGIGKCSAARSDAASQPPPPRTPTTKAAAAASPGRGLSAPPSRVAGAGAAFARELKDSGGGPDQAVAATADLASQGPEPAARYRRGGRPPGRRLRRRRRRNQSRFPPHPTDGPWKRCPRLPRRPNRRTRARGRPADCYWLLALRVRPCPRLAGRARADSIERAGRGPTPAPAPPPAGRVPLAPNTNEPKTVKEAGMESKTMRKKREGLVSFSRSMS